MPYRGVGWSSSGPISMVWKESFAWAAGYPTYGSAKSSMRYKALQEHTFAARRARHSVLSETRSAAWWRTRSAGLPWQLFLLQLRPLPGRVFAPRAERSSSPVTRPQAVDGGSCNCLHQWCGDWAGSWGPWGISVVPGGDQIAGNSWLCYGKLVLDTQLALFEKVLAEGPPSGEYPLHGCIWTRARIK